MKKESRKKKRKTKAWPFLGCTASCTASVQVLKWLQKSGIWVWILGLWIQSLNTCFKVSHEGFYKSYRHLQRVKFEAKDAIASLYKHPAYSQDISAAHMNASRSCTYVQVHKETS